MNNKSIKYILLSVALISSLLFTACNKQSEPVNEVPETTQTEETTTSEEAEQDVSVYMDEDGVPEFNFKQGKVSGHEVDLTDKSLQEETGGDIVGYDGGETLPGEYDAEVHAPQAKEELKASDYNLPISDEDLQKLAELIMQDVYGNSGGGGQVHQATPEQLEALGASPDTGPQRPGVHFGQGGVPDYLKGEIRLE